MKEILEKLKNTKDLTREKYEEMIHKYSHEAVIRQLKEAGLTKEDLSDDEFNELLEQEIKSTRSFTKGAMAGAGLFLFLQFLG